MTNNNANQFIDARPSISIDGREAPDLTNGMISLLIAENSSGLYRCEVLFINWGNVDRDIDFLYFNRRILDFGKSIQVRMGTEDLFAGKITGIEAHYPEGGPPELAVLAEDGLQNMRMTRRTRAFENSSDADIFRRIAGEHGLQSNINIVGPTHSILAQVNQSDLAFLRERARATGVEISIEDNTLNALPRIDRNTANLTLSYGGKLREFSVLADLAMQCTSATVSGWDTAAKQSITSEATDVALGAELNGDLSGASILESSFGERKQSIAHTIPLMHQEARAQADAYFRMSARRFVSGHGIAEPDSRLHVGSSVTLQGLGPLFSGKYYVNEVQHLFDVTYGLRTEIRVERPGLGQTN